ncbi:uncharacterized protein BO80DRAFT_435890 [Aspergillus ibericus CBS 121593]|uniref:EGF-like domain-containing protein n=1 Tax=Aspergillus ibericus CBS 121593 TaxID=1448316 RepID=A0A395GW09_9EURO|nr:hypothetical protein BO80DRAFT_435890 [Aspergillus ibericus CBS 121593]RAK99602.1 hypothetical protein BO80DRAFT_435890 [Aspergillus ibericus CBS 121593]
MTSHKNPLFLFLVLSTLLIQTTLSQFHTSAIITTDTESYGPAITTTIPNSTNDSEDINNPEDLTDLDLDTGISPVSPLTAGPVTCHSVCNEQNKCKCKVNNRILVCNCKGRYSRCGCRTWIPPTRDPITVPEGEEVEVEAIPVPDTPPEGDTGKELDVRDDIPSDGDGDGDGDDSVSGREICSGHCNKHKRCTCGSSHHKTHCGCHDVGKECRCLVGRGGTASDDSDTDTTMANNGDEIVVKNYEQKDEENNQERGISVVDHVLVPRRERCSGICDAKYGCFCKAKNGRAHCRCYNAGQECQCRVPWRRDDGDDTGMEDPDVDDTGADDVGAEDALDDDTGADDTIDDAGADDTDAEDTFAEDTANDNLADDSLTDDSDVPPENIGTINSINGIIYSRDMTPADVLGISEENQPKICHGMMCNKKNTCWFCLCLVDI